MTDRFFVNSLKILSTKFVGKISHTNISSVSDFVDDIH